MRGPDNFNGNQEMIECREEIETLNEKTNTHKNFI